MRTGGPNPEVELSEPAALPLSRLYDSAYASRIVDLEIARVINRYRLQGQYDDQAVATLFSEAKKLMRSIARKGITEQVLVTAARSMSITLGSLDAIHLATAIELGRDLDEPITVLTHDLRLAQASRAHGLDVIGA